MFNLQARRGLAKSNTRIYADYASLTPIDLEVVKEMEKYSTMDYANPSSLYKEGVNARMVLDSTRKKFTEIIHALSDEIIFTSGGTEANNLAILGAVESLNQKGVEYSAMHVVASIIEHSSVRECLNYLNEKGVATDVVKVNSHGVVDLVDLKKKIKSNTVIVSIMMVNNEIGTVQPIKEIAKIVRHARAQFNSPAGESAFNFQNEFAYPLFHTDAAQAPLYFELDMRNLGVDLLTLDSSKIYGPRGVGVLYKKRNVPISPIKYGGSQEFGIRPGTEPIPSIAGFCKAFEMANSERKNEAVRIKKLRDLFISKLKAINFAKTKINNSKVVDFKGVPIPIISESSTVKINGEGAEVSPHIVNVSIPKIDSEFFLLQLDAKGISCSTKSSCLRDEDESYVLKAIGANSHNSIRFSFGRWSTVKDVVRIIEVIKSLLVVT